MLFVNGAASLNALIAITFSKLLRVYPFSNNVFIFGNSYIITSLELRNLLVPVSHCTNEGFWFKVKKFNLGCFPNREYSIV